MSASSGDLLSRFPPENLADQRWLFDFQIAIALENVKKKVATERLGI